MFGSGRKVVGGCGQKRVRGLTSGGLKGKIGCISFLGKWDNHPAFTTTRLNLIDLVCMHSAAQSAKRSLTLRLKSGG